MPDISATSGERYIPPEAEPGAMVQNCVTCHGIRRVPAFSRLFDVEKPARASSCRKALVDKLDFLCVVSQPHRAPVSNKFIVEVCGLLYERTTQEVRSALSAACRTTEPINHKKEAHLKVGDLK